MRFSHPFGSQFLLLSALLTGCGAEPPSGDVFAAQARQRLSGHFTFSKAGAPMLGRLAGPTQLTLTLGLPVQDPEGLASVVADVSNPTSPYYRQYLTPEDFADRFGATVDEYRKVLDWARSRRLDVAPHPNRLIAHLTGTASDIEDALHVHLNRGLRPDGTEFYAPDREPSLDLDVPVSHVSGLENYVRPRRASSGGSGIGQLITGRDFRNAYASCTSLTGAGQSVGILSLGNGFLTGDINSYISQSGFQNVPAVQTIGPAGSIADIEDTLDVEMATSMAPGAQVIAFRGSLSEALGNMAQHTEVKQFSSSFFTALDQTSQTLIAQLAAQGQSFFQASGDNGAYNADAIGGSTDFREQPAVTIVGGTDLNMTYPGGGYSSESAWPGSGGGVISNVVSSNGAGVPIPSYQVGFANANNQASNSYRNAPDVSLIANGIQMFWSGQPAQVSGTSAAAPLWAGFAALINQQAESLHMGSIGFANPAFYLIARSPSYAASFNDVTSGSNPSTTPGPQVTFAATAGFDLTTGLGTPACGLINTLAYPRSSKASPGSAVFGGLLHTAYVANDASNTILHISSTDGVNWGPESPVTGQSTKAPPALVSFNGLLRMFFIANDPSNTLYEITSSDGVNWSANMAVGGHSSKAAPAAAVFNNRLHLVYVANNSTNTLLHVSSLDGVNWGTETPVVGQSSQAAPAVISFGGLLRIFFIANDSSSLLYQVASSDGVDWSTNLEVGGHSSKASPAVTAFNDRLHLTYIANNSTNTLLHLSSPDGAIWGTETAVIGHSSQTGPTLAAFNGALRMSYISNNANNYLLRISSPDGVNWGDETIW